MGILGYPEAYNWELLIKIASNETLSTCANCLYHGINWIYTSSANVYIYDFNLWYFWNNNSIFSEAFNFFFYFVGFSH